MNNVLLSDSYKYSHYNQYPSDAEAVFSYLEARGGEYENIVFFGLQYLLKEYFSKQITYRDVNDAAALAEKHGIPFNKEGWLYIIERHNGYLPLDIMAVQEGSVNKVGDVLMTIQNIDGYLPWLTNWAETLLMKVWYPITVASKAFHVRRMMANYYKDSSFQYHNFGDRGSSSVEAAMIGGMAHLTQFSGTDNFNAVSGCEKYYGGPFGFSIPATEHSTVTSWGREDEYRMIESYLETYRNNPIIACVLDSYDIYKAVDFVTSSAMKEKIESNDYPVFVIRPDSGEPVVVLRGILEVMERNCVGHTLDEKGRKLFNKYRIIWGDGVNPKTIMDILAALTAWGYAPENIAFGSGGDLMQKIDRDTCKFAIKCSAIKRGGKWMDVYKDPITDSGKRSKRGLLTSENLEQTYYFGTSKWIDKWADQSSPFIRHQDFGEIRTISSSHLGRAK